MHSRVGGHIKHGIKIYKYFFKLKMKLCYTRIDIINLLYLIIELNGKLVKKLKFQKWITGVIFKI